MRKILLWVELVTLFVVLPLLYTMNRTALPRIPLLLAVFAGCLVVLFRSPEYNRRELIHALSGHLDELKWIMIRSLFVAVFCIAAVILIDPSLLFALPLNRPGLWIMVVLLYPLLSAYPQELIYRAFFFHRYESILKSQAALIWSSTLVFSYLHIVFDNWIAVVLTIPAGYMFARTYCRSGSLLMASIEHGLYGCILFTSGLGRFFYTPN